VAEATVQSYETKPLGDSFVSFATLTEKYSDQKGFRIQPVGCNSLMPGGHGWLQ
jgi:hypothetical protein